MNGDEWNTARVLKHTEGEKDPAIKEAEILQSPISCWLRPLQSQELVLSGEGKGLIIGQAGRHTTSYLRYYYNRRILCKKPLERRATVKLRMIFHFSIIQNVKKEHSKHIMFKEKETQRFPEFNFTRADFIHFYIKYHMTVTKEAFLTGGWNRIRGVEMEQIDNSQWKGE